MFNPQCSKFPPPTHESGWSKLIINWPKLVFNLFFENRKLVNQLMTSLHQLLTSLDMPTETKYMSTIQESTNLQQTATNNFRFGLWWYGILLQTICIKHENATISNNTLMEAY